MKKVFALIILVWALFATICVNAQNYGPMYSSNPGYIYDSEVFGSYFLNTKIDDITYGECANTRVVQSMQKINWGNASFIDCPGGVTKNQTGINKYVTGNFKTDLLSNALFVLVNTTSKTATALETFKRTGINKDLGIKILSFEKAPGVIVIYSQTNLATEINGIALPAFGVGICDFNTGVFTPRNDLILYAGANATPIEDFQRLSNGKCLAVGAGDRMGSAAGPVANHGYIIESDGITITNLNLPGSSVVAAKRILEDGSFVWIGTDISSTPVFKMDLATNVLTAVPMGGLRMNIYGIANVNNYTVFTGSTKGGASPTTQTILAYNNTTNVWEDWSGNIFPTTSTSNIAHDVIGLPCETRCSNSIMVLTNNPVQYAASNCPYVALPVNLISFDARRIENQVKLTWETSNEKNFSYFELQRSSDTKNFETIETVLKFDKSFYSALDESPNQGENYYRLKMVDIDGTFNFSKIIFINENEKSEEMVLLMSFAHGKLYEKNGKKVFIEN